MDDINKIKDFLLRSSEEIEEILSATFTPNSLKELFENGFIDSDEYGERIIENTKSFVSGIMYADSKPNVLIHFPEKALEDFKNNRTSYEWNEDFNPSDYIWKIEGPLGPDMISIIAVNSPNKEFAHIRKDWFSFEDLILKMNETKPQYILC